MTSSAAAATVRLGVMGLERSREVAGLAPGLGTVVLVMTRGALRTHRLTRIFLVTAGAFEVGMPVVLEWQRATQGLFLYRQLEADVHAQGAHRVGDVTPRAILHRLLDVMAPETLRFGHRGQTLGGRSGRMAIRTRHLVVRGVALRGDVARGAVDFPVCLVSELTGRSQVDSEGGPPRVRS